MRRCSKERHESTEGYDLFGHYVLVSVLLDGNIKTNSPHKNSVYRYICTWDQFKRSVGVN